MRRTFTTTAFALLACLPPLAAQLPADTVFTRAEQMPCFTGCEALAPGTDAKRRCSEEELVRFISRWLAYPPQAKAAGVEGTVYVSFIVDEQGLVAQPALLSDIGGGCGEAALDVLREMPRWEPALHDGQRVKVRLNLPIQFALRKTASDLSENFTLTWGDLRGETATAKELQDNLASPVQVRDPLGNNRYVDGLAFTFEKNSRLVNATSRGDISGELARVVGRARQGGDFTITASVQENGEFIYVSRSFRVVGD